MIWRIVHAVTAIFWICFVAFEVLEIVSTGNLHREAAAAGVYDTSFALFILIMFSATAASALRALWIEARP